MVGHGLGSRKNFFYGKGSGLCKDVLINPGRWRREGRCPCNFSGLDRVSSLAKSAEME
jgi:hypothetical protein